MDRLLENFMTDTRLKLVCKLGQREQCCRYLGYSTEGWMCFRIIPALKQMVDERSKEQTMKAKGDGDGCEGDPNPELELKAGFEIKPL